MYEYIKGIVNELNPSMVVIENHQVGYGIQISLYTYSKLKVNVEAKLFLHQIIKEDAHSLFGFFDKQERELFRLLISVNGIGANTARLILSSLNPQEIEGAIIQENVSILKSIKGIGLKTAQRIIIDLKDKIGKDTSNGELFSLPDNSIRIESLSALTMLGFQRNIAEKAIGKLLAENSQLSVEELIKQALKIL